MAQPKRSPAPALMPRNRPLTFRLLSEYAIDANGRTSSTTNVRAWPGASGAEAREIYPNIPANAPDWFDAGANTYLSSRLLPLSRLFAELAPALAASVMVESAGLPPAERIESVLVRLVAEVSAGGPSRREWPVSVMFVAYQDGPPYRVLIHQRRSGEDYLPEHWPDWSQVEAERLDIKAKRFRATIDSPGWRSLRLAVSARYRPAIGALLAAVPHSKSSQTS